MKKSHRSLAFGKLLLWMALCCPIVVQAQQFGQQPQEERELAPVSRTYAITNATITPGPGRKITQATLDIKNGLITAVGKGVANDGTHAMMSARITNQNRNFVLRVDMFPLPHPKS